jgi:hypothetical protein
MLQFFTFPVLLIVVGSITAAVGGCWLTVKQAEERAQAAMARAQAEKDLREQSDEIARLNQRLADLVTGGTGFAYLSLLVQEGNTFLVGVVNEGDTPLYDVAGHIVDLAESNALPSGRKYLLSLDPKNQFNVGNLGAHQSSFVTRLNLGTGDAKNYNISISARNGFVTQLLRCRRTPAGWRCATRVIRTGEGREVLYEQMDEGFPKDRMGKFLGIKHLQAI